MESVIDFLENFITPTFGYLWIIYSDNDLHFIGSEVTAYFESKGITYYDALVAHPSSVGLVEQSIQLVASRLRAYAIENSDHGLRTWGKALPGIMLATNT